MRTIATFLFAISGLQATPQEVGGRILDEKKEPLVNAVIQIFQAGILKGGIISDLDGNYVVKPLDPGTYDVLAFNNGYDSALVTNVIVRPDSRTQINLQLVKATGKLKCIKSAYKQALVESPSRRPDITDRGIPNIPTTPVIDLANNSANPYYHYNVRDENGPINVGGARDIRIKYIVVSFDKVSVITSGRPSVTVVPLDLDGPKYVLTRKQIAQMPLQTINDLISVFPCVYQARCGDPISISGGRIDGNAYYIDGVRQ